MGGSSVTSGLTRQQKDIQALLKNYLLQQPSGREAKIPIGTKHHPAYADLSKDFGFLSLGASPLPATGTKTHPATMPINYSDPTLAHVQKSLKGVDFSQGLAQAMQALAPSLAGKQALNYKPLSGTPLSVGNVNLGTDYKYDPFNFKPIQATGALADSVNRYNYNPLQVNSGYNYNPDQVKSAFNYMPDQIKANYDYKPGTVNSTLDNEKFTQDYFQKSVMNPLLRQYDTAISPRINDAAAAAGSTFSTRTQVAKQQALQDLQTQATAQLASAARQDNIERSQQQLAAQEFNVGTATQNAQFGNQQNLTASQLNQAAGLNAAEFGAGQNLTAQQLNQAAGLQNAQFANQQNLTAQQLNQAAGLQNAQFGAGQQLNYDTLNKQTALGLGQLNQGGALAAHQANTQGALGAASLKAQLAQAMAQMNLQKDITVGQSNQQNAYAYNALNSQNQIGLAENAAQRQLAAVGQQQAVQNAPLQRMLAALGGGAQLNAVGQGNLDRNYAEFLRTAPENNPWLRTLLGFTGQDPNAIVAPSQMSQISQGVAAGAGALTGLGSLASALGGAGALGGSALALPAAYGAGAGALGTLGGGAAATGAELGATALGGSGAAAGIGEGLLSLLSFL